MSVIKLGKQILMVLGLAFIPYVYYLRNAVPGYCQHVYYESGVRAGKLAAEHGGLAAIGVDGSFMCGLFYVESALIASLLFGVAVFVGGLLKRYLEYEDTTGGPPAFRLSIRENDGKQE
jgi:hypothetical protein